MKNIFSLFTKLWLVYRWLTMDYTSEIVGIYDPVVIPLRKAYSLNNYLYVWKQKLLVHKRGEEAFLKMTIAEILQAKV